ncbi:spermatogenesis-associated protein 48 [Mugil cephalus]|uniref:spermatogenesis-associated protein 48 n=1 Tax=Mugil cephalus TaxID=48193 RepID=UPI001FB66D7A|nr:spermatogenesis-associated protein 48 [Mugil cephalus]
MTADLDSSKPFSTELDVIRRLNSSLSRDGCRHGRGAGRALSPGLHTPAERAAPAPSRDDVPLLDPCCGQLSAGAEVDLGVKGRRKFIDFRHVASALRVPPGFGERPQTAPVSPGFCANLSKDEAWDSRRIPDAALRARLCGSAGPVDIQPRSLRTSTEGTTRGRLPDKHAGRQGTFSSDLGNSAAVQHFIYTSATQRSYEEVFWDRKLPAHSKAPEINLEKRADPVSERPSSRRYHSRPQLWQSIGAEWNRRQLRSRSDAKKPVSFCSGCPRSGQIPLYTGTIGSENMNNIDNIDEQFHPLTLKRSIVPPYTPTARRTTIPGYTGKACHVNSAVSRPGVSSPAGSHGEPGSSVFGHVAPLSRMVTTTAPCNPSLRPALPVSRANTRGGIRRRR